MKKMYSKSIKYDENLKLEAFKFKDFSRPFKEHFHSYYVIGSVTKGLRNLSCTGKDYILNPGTITVFNPGDIHSCASLDTNSDKTSIDYCSINIPKAVAARFFSGMDLENIIQDNSISTCFHELHNAILKSDFEQNKNKVFKDFIEKLLKYSYVPSKNINRHCTKIEKACKFIRDKYFEPISLDEICAVADLNKPSFLRAFVKHKGITPHSYIKVIRINKAREFLTNGVSLLETAYLTGFLDQSHFTNCFSATFGISPGEYRKIHLGLHAKGGTL